MSRFRGQVRTAAEVPSRLEAAFAVIGTPYVFGCPERLARRLARTLPIRLLPFPTRALPPAARPRPYDLVVQWHPVHEDDPAHRWLRTTLAEVAAKS